VALYGAGDSVALAAAAPIPSDTLREFVAYARAHCRPELGPEAAQRLCQAYAEMRAAGASRKVVSATPRQLESLIRLSEALARMRLDRSVRITDVDEAVRLIRVAMQQSSIDPRTGQIDMDVIQTGVSAADRASRAALAGELRTLVEARAANGGVRLADLLEEINTAQGGGTARVSERDLRLALAELDDVARVQQGMVVLRA
jgi:DNA replication licensing factor MCM4